MAHALISKDNVRDIFANPEVLTQLSVMSQDANKEMRKFSNLMSASRGG